MPTPSATTGLALLIILTLTACDWDWGTVCQGADCAEDDEAGDDEPVELQCMKTLYGLSNHCFYDLPADEPPSVYGARQCVTRWDYKVARADGVFAAAICLDSDPDQWTSPGSPIAVCEDPTELFDASGFELPGEWLDDDMQDPACLNIDVHAKFTKGLDHCETLWAGCHAACESDSDCPAREPFCEDNVHDGGRSCVRGVALVSG